MKELCIRIEHLQKSYTRPVLTDINLSVTNDSYVTIVGKSGSGKSTMLNILGLVEGYDAGEYSFNGTLIRNGMDYAKLRLENIGFIFQSYNLIPTLSCKENILLPLLYNKHNKVQDFDELVDLLDLAPLLSQRVTTLSGGEKQRVAIARSLILNPCLILADEPTGNLDPKNRDIIMNLLRHEHEKGRGIILITHDMDIANQADTVFLLEGGKLHKRKTNDVYVFPSPNGGPISPDSVNNMLKRVLERAGIPKVRFHDLRHTFATIALQNGVDIKTVSGMLGHFSAGFTLDTYAHVTTSAQKEAAQTMGNILSV